ncbi:TolC family protein [Tautonia plasticadhaerens]|uniref:Cobalt-zinc-cadmium resistance protein CzcC n=1 Tax=Tautonia plasticadhaerens TaxID=2527974 RepID=A0A518H0F8_9BACT|nr:TolC family protein [Tautonia plasticadhaerens]QDV34317.1 Cobalt-zinc-cadmium resistance protein CzcC precursor [Tautonia plasticadhaerens]
MTNRTAIGRIAPVLAALLAPGAAEGRQDSGPAGQVEIGAPGFESPVSSSLGQMPGSGGNLGGNAPGSDRPVIGGGTGASGRVPPSLSTPGGDQFQDLGGAGMGLVPGLPEPSVPIFGPMTISDIEDEGPPDGLTLDQAVALLVRNNLTLRSRFFELPKARADILTASLYPNPLLFYDAQLVPYGNYSEEQPGGPVQHDLNIQHPIDLTNKVGARTRVAERAYTVLEAQYRDAVRIEMDNLYRTYLGVLLARRAVDFSRAAVTGLESFLETVRDRRQEELATEVDVNQILLLREQAMIGLEDAIQSERAAKIRLGTLLNLPPSQAEQIPIRGTLFKTETPDPPLGAALVRLALESRPDLAAFRMGVDRSRADLDLALANRLADVYMLYQPFTYQDNDVGVGEQGSYSWALGLTVPLPLYNRNQGNIQRAKLNVEQTKVELTSQERQVVAEVIQAEREYLVSRAAAERLRQVSRPAAEQILETAKLRYRAGEQDLLYVLNAYREYNGFVRQYLSTWLRYRRAMLSLNTAVGRRILP